jgi:hypothetical protein
MRMLEAIVDIFVGHFREYVALHQVPVQACQKCVMAIWAYVPCMRLLEGRGSCRQGVSPGHHAFGQPVDIGLTKPLVIETDGAIEQADALKAAYSGAVQTDLQVAHDPPDKALLLLGIAARQVGLRALSGQFLSCRIKCVCGGGLYAHRYRPGSGFLQPVGVLSRSLAAHQPYTPDHAGRHRRPRPVPDACGHRPRPTPGCRRGGQAEEVDRGELAA